MPSPDDFNYPLLNASLNGVAFLLLVLGYAMIRGGQKKLHIICMVSALVTSTLFLISYVTYHSLTAGVMTKFPTEYPTARGVYLAILFTHIPLAGILVPLVLMTVIPALRDRFDKHKRWAKITLPIWLYVSVTGVLIYFMLYRWYLPTTVETPAIVSQEVTADDVGSSGSAAASGGGEGDTAAMAASAAELSFAPEVFKIHAQPDEDVVTARYEIKNSGTRTVQITGLDTNCHCLDVRADAQQIAAGATVVVEADFSLEKLVGVSEKTVIVYTDDSEFSEIRLGVEVKVDPIYSIEPLTLDWKVGEKNSSKEIVFKVVRDKPIHITDVQHSKESVFTVDLREVEPGREYRLVLTPNSTEKELLGFVKVFTDCEIDKYARELMYFKISRREN